MNCTIEERITINSIIKKCIDVPLSYKQDPFGELSFTSDIVSYSQIELKLITTENYDNYLLIAYGYDIPEKYGDRTIFGRIRDCILHIRIDEEAIKIYQDKLQHGITNELIEAGISESKILSLYSEKQEPVQYVVNLKKVYEFNQNCFSSNSSFDNPILKPELNLAEINRLERLDLEYFNKAILKHKERAS